MLVFDEAHLLDGDALRPAAADQFRAGRAAAAETSARRPGTVPPFCGAEHANLLNRISVRYQLRPLTREQTCRYIDFQLSQAGGDSKLFDDSVKAAIHDFANGVPRHINNLATACLLQATARKVRRIDDELFQQVVGEFQLP